MPVTPDSLIRHSIQYATVAIGRWSQDLHLALANRGTYTDCRDSVRYRGASIVSPGARVVWWDIELLRSDEPDERDED